MLKTIYLILTGEDSKKRPRSKKLLKIIEKSHTSHDEYKIIISGLSGFNLNVSKSGSSELSNYLISKNIPKENIILEEESLDTLGNMIFSYKIIENIVRANSTNILEIVLVTEGFHLKRSKKIFLRLFVNLKNINHNLSFNFIAANTAGISQFYWKRKLNVIAEKYKRHIQYGKDIRDYLKKIILIDKKYMQDFIILGMILFDIERLKLQTYDEFKNYLFSLPIYNQKYKSKYSYSLKYSVYAHTITHLLHKRENND